MDRNHDRAHRHPRHRSSLAPRSAWPCARPNFTASSPAGTAARGALRSPWAPSTPSPPTPLRPPAPPRSRPRRAHLRHPRLHGAALRRLGSEHMVTDVGSTKAQITVAAERLLQPHRARGLPPRSSHGRQGARRSGPRRRHLFRGAVWLFTDDPAWQRSAHSAALARAGASGSPQSAPRSSISTPSATTSWSPGSATCPSL